MALTIYGANVSPFVRKVRVLLAEKGVDYTLEQINIFAPPDWFAEISPAKRIPVLRDTDIAPDFTLPDSSCICAYLERRHSEPALYPQDDAEYGQALFIEEYADSELMPVFGSGVFRPRIVFPLAKKVAPDEETVADAIANKLPPLYDIVTGWIAGREYFVGDRLSIADIAVASMFVNMRHAEALPDPTRWPELAAFIDRMHARPSFAACIDEEAKVFSLASVKARLARG